MNRNILLAARELCHSEYPDPPPLEQVALVRAQQLAIIKFRSEPINYDPTWPITHACDGIVPSLENQSWFRFRPEEEPVRFLERLRHLVTLFGKDYIYCANTATYFGPDFMSDVERIYAKAPSDLQVFSIRGKICAEFWSKSSVKLLGELSVGGTPDSTDEYARNTQILENLRDPTVVFSLFVWKSSALIRTLDNIIAMRPVSMPDLAREIFCSASQLIQNCKPTLKTPAVIIERPESGSYLLSLAECYTNASFFDDALSILGRVESRFGLNPQTTFLKSICKLSKLNNWEAMRDIKRQLNATPNSPQLDELLTQISAVTPERGFTFQQVAGAIDSVFGFLIPGQEEFLFNQVRALPDDAVIVEIGSHQGRSTTAMAFACLGTNKRIIAIDPWYGGDGVMDIFENNLRRLGLDHLVTPIKGTSEEVLTDWGSRPKIDFIFIDGSHTYEDVNKDFHLCYGLVREGGSIAFHDLAPSSLGPWRLWRELASDVLIEHSFCASIACGKKPFNFETLPSPRPFSYSEDFIQYVRDTFPLEGRLIEALSLSRNPSTLESMVPSLEREISLMPDELKGILASYAQGTEANDGYIRYWFALTLERDKKYNEAFQEIRNYIKSPCSPSASRIRGVQARLLERHLSLTNQHVDVLKALN